MKLVVDWDGTITVRDTLWMLMERFGDRALFERTEDSLGTTISFREVMEEQMATITAPLEEAVAFLVAEARIRPGFAALAARHDARDPLERLPRDDRAVLAREGLDLAVVANRIDARSDGWRVLWNDATACAECGDLCKRRALPAGRPLVYVGDGYSDRCAALAADRVFARRALADYLVSQNMPFEPFETFDDVAAALT